MANPYSSGAVYIWVGLKQSFASLQGTTVSTTDVASNVGSQAGNLASLSAVANITVQSTFWASIISTLTPVYLGTGHFAPVQKHRRHFSPVINDQSGPAKPHDKMYVGQDGMVSVQLTHWNEAVYQLIASLPVPGGPPGRDARASMGTLMLTEGLAYPLWLRYPNTDFHPAMQAAGQPPGYRYIATHLEGEEEEERGTKENVRHLMWYAYSVMQPDGSHSCYDYNMTGVPPIPPSP